MVYSASTTLVRYVEHEHATREARSKLTMWHQSTLVLSVYFRGETPCVWRDTGHEGAPSPLSTRPLHAAGVSTRKGKKASADAERDNQSTILHTTYLDGADVFILVGFGECSKVALRDNVCENCNEANQKQHSVLLLVCA